MIEKELAECLQIEKLTPWLSEYVPELGDGPLQAEVLSGGATNLVCKISCGGEVAALRRPAIKKRGDDDRIMDREARVLEALKGSEVPHPRFIGHCDDKSVMGASFYLMELVDGWQSAGANACPPPFDQPGEHRRNMAFALIDGIAELSKVDYLEVGLAGFGKPEGFLERQVDRWLYQFNSYKESDGYEGRKIDELDYVADWLQDNRPDHYAKGIMHGDYGFANVIYHHGTPTRLAAIIDWELCTVGDPMLDLGFLVYNFRGREGTNPTGNYFDPTDFPYREEMVARYAENTGADVSQLTYYMVLAQFKLASLLEGHYARYLAGKQEKGKGMSLGGMVQPLIHTAAEMARQGR